MMTVHMMTVRHHASAHVRAANTVATGLEGVAARHGGSMGFKTCNIRSEDEIEALFEHVVAAHGQCFVLFSPSPFRPPLATRTANSNHAVSLSFAPTHTDTDSNSGTLCARWTHKGLRTKRVRLFCNCCLATRVSCVAGRAVVQRNQQAQCLWRCGSF